MSGNAFDLTDLTTWKIAAGDSGEMSGAKSGALPHLAAFLDQIRSQLAAPDEALGRRYQRDVVNSGALEVISPFTGQATRATESFLALGRIFFRFSEREEFYVAAARVKFGYPLVALFVPRANLLVRWRVENDKRGVEPKHLAALGEIVAEQTRERAGFAQPQTTTILIGHKNFAHHLWNELPALERLLRDVARDRIPQLLVMREPLGRLDALFPEVAEWKIERLRGRSPSLANGNGKLFVNLGSFRVTSSVRRRVLAHARRVASSKARNLEEEIRGSTAPVFWVSVRTQSPTPTNQREVLAELGTRILRDFQACTVLFDGFSLPEDWDQSEDSDISFYRTSAYESRREIEAIIADIIARRAPSESQRFANLGGWGILDCIATAPLSNCYFCHVGTVQHKIGWITDVPGMIHANRRIISRKTPIWYAHTRLENGVIPVTIPANMVTAAGKEEDYEILDIAGVAEHVCEFFRVWGLQSGNANHNRHQSPTPGL